MSRCPRILTAILLFELLWLNHAASDVSPSPMTGGRAVSPYEDGPTEVRMVAEDVVVRIYADSIVTVGSFSMRNDGETVRMEVGFPFYRADDLIRFRAFVDERPVDVRDGRKEHADRQKHRRWTVYWKLWDMTFQEGDACTIRVEYETKPLQHPTLFAWSERHAALPADVLGDLERASTIARVEYTLETGKHWKGALDRCRVSFELVGMSDGHIQYFWPEDGTVAENGVVWEYADYEPSRQATLSYFPHTPIREIPEFLHGILERYPDYPPLADRVGRFYASHLARNDLLRDTYHDFLARWNEPIPQLMEYAPGGRCRFDYQAGNHFYTVWRMAWVLFEDYGKSGRIDEGIDIAPKVSRISAAIVDSLDTCTLTRRDAWLFQRAKELRDRSNELIAEHE